MFGWFHVYLSGNLCYLNMSIKGQYGTSNGTTQPSGSVCVYIYVCAYVCPESIDAAGISGKNRIQLNKETVMDQLPTPPSHPTICRNPEIKFS